MVTTSTWSSWNSRHADTYHLVVKAGGSHVPNHCVAKLLTSTARIISMKLATNSPITVQSATLQMSSDGVLVPSALSANIGQPFPDPVEPR